MRTSALKDEDKLEKQVDWNGLCCVQTLKSTTFSKIFLENPKWVTSAGCLWMDSISLHLTWLCRTSPDLIFVAFPGFYTSRGAVKPWCNTGFNWEKQHSLSAMPKETKKKKQFPECVECCSFPHRCGKSSFHARWHPSVLALAWHLAQTWAGLEVQTLNIKNVWGE